MHAVKVLIQSTVHSTDKLETKLFEEAIYLTTINLDAFQHSSELSQFIIEQLNVEQPTYYNGYGEIVAWQVAKIIDIYPCDEHLKLPYEMFEIYSRFLEMPAKTTIEDVIERYYQEYVWQQS